MKALLRLTQEHLASSQLHVIPGRPGMGVIIHQVRPACSAPDMPQPTLDTATVQDLTCCLAQVSGTAPQG